MNQISMMMSVHAVGDPIAFPPFFFCKDFTGFHDQPQVHKLNQTEKEKSMALIALENYRNREYSNWEQPTASVTTQNSI